MTENTDKFKAYLNSIIGKIPDDIHNELWERLIEVISATPTSPEPQKESAATSFANWLTKNFWVHRGGVGDNAVWRCDMPGSEWGEGELKTTPELYEIYKSTKELKTQSK